MALKSAATMREEVQTAISKILGGAQEYEIGNRSFTMADLGELRQMEQYYAAEAKREAAGGITMRSGVKA